MNFIETYQIEDLQICHDINDMFNNPENIQKPGIVHIGGTKKIRKDIKDSTDITINLNDNNPVINSYITQLQVFIEQYISKYWFCNVSNPFTITEDMTIQRYPPGGGYKVWHFERSGDSPQNMRHLVFMTYLNTIEEENYGGGTEWYYQDFKAKAEIGKTVIWPADWTHTHTGIISNTSEKTIITGWLSYY